MRTFSRADWQAAQAQWEDGQFSDEWAPFRHAAAMRGMLYPPDGTRWDSWEDDEPSQRAQLIRAIRETPKLLHRAISVSRTWFEVIAYVNARRDEMKRDISWQSDLADRDKAERTPDEQEATRSLAAILERIKDSVP